MRIFLMWARDSRAGAELEPEEVARALQNVMDALFAAPPPVAVERNAAAAMVFVQIPARGWTAPFVQEDEHGRAYVTDHPVGLRRALAAAGERARPGAELAVLGRRLARDPAPVLAELAPPFALTWWPIGRDEALLQTDGLGQAQVFTYDDGSLWAATNKITALRALGVRLDPDPVGWAGKATSGWFPLDRTGFRHVTFGDPGTQIRIDRAGVHRRTVDVLEGWLHPAPTTRAEALEAGRAAMVQHIRDGAPYFDGRPDAGLSGGWDTRAVVSSFAGAGVDVRLKVKGQEGKFDVMLARRLAEIAGLDLEVRPKAELPPERTEDLERSLRLALLWQAGHMWSENHKTFLWSEERHVDGGALNVMGQHGEIVRGHYERRARAWEAAGPEDYEDRAVAFIMNQAPAALRDDLRDDVRELLHAAYRRAARYGLDGLAALDLLYLLERTRRYNGASLEAQFGFVFTPFLNPGLIRAAYGLRAAGGAFVADRRQVNPLHRHIIETNMPAWRGIEFEEDLRRAARRAAREAAARADQAGEPPAPPVRDWRPSPGKQYYDYDLYWAQVGGPLVERLTSEDGAWTEVFDAARVREEGQTPPVEVALVALVAEATAPAGA
jgi:hypothetical protein